MDGFEDPGSAWHQFSHSLGKFVQILFFKWEKSLDKGPRRDETNVYDSLNCYGQRYSRETGKVICQKTYFFFYHFK